MQRVGGSRVPVAYLDSDTGKCLVTELYPYELLPGDHILGLSFCIQP